MLDTVDNLSQIGNWTLQSAMHDQHRIELFLRLIRKNMNALMDFPAMPEFDDTFKQFCSHYEELEAEYKSGKSDRKLWANTMLTWANKLGKSARAVWPM